MLEQKLAEAKSKKDTLKARAKSAAASKQITEMIQGLNTSNALTAFDKMEEKVMALEAESESTLQVGLLWWRGALAQCQQPTRCSLTNCVTFVAAHQVSELPWFHCLLHRALVMVTAAAAVPSPGPCKCYTAQI